MDQRNLAMGLASLGRGSDTALIHMSPSEIQALQRLAEQHGGSLTINPQTGLPEAGFLTDLLPMIGGIGLSVVSGGTLSPLMIGLITGVGTGLATGDPLKGIMGAFGGWGGAGLASGISAAATAPAGAVATEAASIGAKEVASQSLALGQAAGLTAEKAIFSNLSIANQAIAKSAGQKAAQAWIAQSAKTAASAAGPFARAGTGTRNFFSGLGNILSGSPGAPIGGALPGVAPGVAQGTAQTVAGTTAPAWKSLAQPGFTTTLTGGAPQAVAGAGGQLLTPTGLGAFAPGVTNKYLTGGYGLLAGAAAGAVPSLFAEPPELEEVDPRNGKEVKFPQYAEMDREYLNPPFNLEDTSEQRYFERWVPQDPSQAQDSMQFGAQGGIVSLQEGGSIGEQLYFPQDRNTTSVSTSPTPTFYQNFSPSDMAALRKVAPGIFSSPNYQPAVGGGINVGALPSAYNSGRRALTPTGTTEGEQLYFSNAGGGLVPLNNGGFLSGKVIDAVKQAREQSYFPPSRNIAPAPAAPSSFPRINFGGLYNYPGVMAPAAAVSSNLGREAITPTGTSGGEQLYFQNRTPAPAPQTNLQQQQQQLAYVQLQQQARPQSFFSGIGMAQNPEPHWRQSPYNLMTMGNLGQEQQRRTWRERQGMSQAEAEEKYLASSQYQQHQYQQQLASEKARVETARVAALTPLEQEGELYDRRVAMWPGLGTIFGPRPGGPAGGAVSLQGGGLTAGAGDGMSDEIMTTIAGKQRAALSPGEFVVPADVVSGIGNGDTNSGAKRLYAMMDNIRGGRTGKTKQPQRISPRLPA
jgi:hypothetical protein